MPNNPITKIQVIVMKIRTLILISCKETGSDCKGYAYLVTKYFQTPDIFLILKVFRAENDQNTSSMMHNSSSSKSRPFSTHKWLIIGDFLS